MQTVETDFLIIGSGVAGLTSALLLASSGRVLVVTKREESLSNSAWAQGGVSCALGGDDSLSLHKEDTFVAGAGLCNAEAVDTILRGGPDAIRLLESWGMRFSRQTMDPETYDLGIEGGHQRRRVLHAGDITGREIIRALLDAVHNTPNIEVMENCMAIDLVTSGGLRIPGPPRCHGAYFQRRHTGEIFAVRAGRTILATGGAGKAYLYTSNPDTATGDGIAMAWRAGLPVVNMEMVQFHPTVLHHPKAPTFLISEAVRGEGGILVNGAGERFMPALDARADLAPRDIVARAIDYEMKRRGDTCVYLDISHVDGASIQRRFPTIYAKCLECGFDMAKEPIPVVPAAHYFCGGVRAAVDGRTDLEQLYAVGEVTCTGLHGANRLASNSLLEGLVCAGYLAAGIIKEGMTPARNTPSIPDWQIGHAVPSDEAVVVEHNWNEVRMCLWDYVGIVRTDKRLERALRRIRNLREEIREYYLDYLVSPDVLELRNITAVAELITRSALRRKESRGLHYNLDYPQTLEVAVDTVIRDKPGGLI